MKRTLAMIVFAVALAPGADAQPKIPTGPVLVRTWTSQTAAYVGDRITYVIELACAPGVEILPDDLAPERMKLEGLEVVDTASERDASAGERVVQRMRYTLVTYSIDAPSLGIAPLPVRYSVRQPGQKGEDALPAGEVTVPALTLGWRSTLPASGTVVDIRDSRQPRPLPARIRYARPIGLALLAVAAAPVGIWVAGLLHRAHRARPKRPRRPSARARREALDALKNRDVSSAAALREAYAGLDAWIREQLQYRPGFAAAAALTPAEIASRVPAATDRYAADQLERLLMECERAKYAPEAPAEPRWPAVVDEAAELTMLARR